ncbi:hypothetical protein FPOAC2_05420 [Fusarium poae]
MKLIRASPTMLWQYTTDRYSIARDILRPILALDDAGTILQDALIVVHSRNHDVRLDTDYDLSRLLARDRPDPVAQKDKDMTVKLYRTISFAICWIEDYISKATDPFPSQAYMALPEMATGWTGMRYQDEIADIKPVFFSQFMSSERCRFLRAFLRMEVLLRSYVLVPFSLRFRWMHITPFWFLIHGPNDKDWNAVLCCATYFCILSKFLFDGSIWVEPRRSPRIAYKQNFASPSLPDRPSLESITDTSLERRTSLRFPESVCVYTGPYSPYLYCRILSFSDLSFMLLSATRTGKKPDYKTFTNAQKVRLHNLRFSVTLLEELSAERRLNNTVTRSYGSLGICIDRMNGSPESPLTSCYIEADYLHENIRLQRAFGMFEDERLYPGGKCTIPSLEDLERLADDTWRSCGVSKDEPSVIKGHVYTRHYR